MKRGPVAGLGSSPLPARRLGRRLAGTIGLAALAGWAVWWALSAEAGHLLGGGRLWTLANPGLCADFRVHIDPFARVWARGVDPYRYRAWICQDFPYPPMVPRLFLWVDRFSPETAWRIWLAAIGLILVGSAVVVTRTRHRLGLASPPWPVVAGLLAISTPAVVAMERGQCDPLVVPLLIGSAWLLGRPGKSAELAAGGLLGLAAWIKYYPAAALLVLVVGRRRWAVAAFLIAVVGVGLYDRAGLRRSLANGARMALKQGIGGEALHPVQHAIGPFWRAIWAEALGPWAALGRVPSPIVSAVVLAPPTLLVAIGLARASRARFDRLALPAMLWLASASTFALPYSNDYNLIALPMAALAIVRRGDSPTVLLAIGLLIPYWQPWRLQIGGPELFAAKLIAVYALAWSFYRLATIETSQIRPIALPRPHLWAA